MGLEWNWRESSPCNLLIVQRLSFDYTLLRSSISKKRPSSCDTYPRCCDALRAAMVQQFLYAHSGLVFRQLPKLYARELHKLVRRHAWAVRTSMVRLGNECTRLSFDRRGFVH